MWARVTRVSSERIGVLGGTFDPIHLGHLVVASEVCAVLELDRLILVPAHQQPFKDSTGHATPEQRLAMCRLAVEGDDRLEVSDVDIARGGLTYTVDTLADIAAAYPDAELFFIAGADAVSRLSEWREPERLMKLARFVGVARQGHAVPALSPPHLVVETLEVRVSSTEVRRRRRAGAPVRYLVPDAVAAYVALHALYLGGSDV